MSAIISTEIEPPGTDNASTELNLLLEAIPRSSPYAAARLAKKARELAESIKEHEVKRTDRLEDMILRKIDPQELEKFSVNSPTPTDIEQLKKLQASLDQDLQNLHQWMLTHRAVVKTLLSAYENSSDTSEKSPYMALPKPEKVESLW